RLVPLRMRELTTRLAAVLLGDGITRVPLDRSPPASRRLMLGPLPAGLCAAGFSCERAVAGAALPGGLFVSESAIDPTFYRTAADAAAAPPEKLAYVVAFDRAAKKSDAMTV